MMRACYIAFGMLLMLIIAAGWGGMLERVVHFIIIAVAFFALGWYYEHKDKK